MKTPDLTPAHLLAILQAAIAVAVAFGIPLHPSQQIALLSLAGALSGLLIAADAAIRRGRAQHVAAPAADQAAAQAIQTAALAANPMPATPDPVKAATTTAASEAEAEQAAQAANAAGIDPATQTS